MKSYIIEVTGENSCNKCLALQGQVFSLDEAEVGVNFPPIHPNCNCSIIVSDKEANEMELDLDVDDYIAENGINVLNVPNRTNQVDFLNSILKGSVLEQLRTGIPWQVTMAQAAQETGWGSSVMVDNYSGQDSNNLFGIKYIGSPSDTGKFVRVWTTEYIDESELGQWEKEQARWALNGEPLVNTGDKDSKGRLKIKVIQPFKVFSSRDESIVGHSQTLSGDVYAKAAKYMGDPYAYLKAISDIYATDSNYYKDVASIITMYLDWIGK